MSQGRGRAFWEKLVREVEDGASQSSVAKKYQVSQSWVGIWCRRLRGESGNAALLPVRIVDVRTRRLDVFVGSMRVSFEEGTNPAYVADLTRALAQ